jgi:23S rRNA (uridine2552-2'-O)-methyltransferase
MYRKDHKNESYTVRAKKEGYPARSVYKLKEIDERYKIIKQGDWVLDLGSAPGSWMLYISKKIGERGKVLGIDTEETEIKAGNVVFIKKDIKEADLAGRRFNVVVSDLAPKTTGIKSVDSARSLELAELAFEISRKTLLPRGNFVCKIFESEETDSLIKEIEKSFRTVKRFRPLAVYKGSKEFYIIAEGFKKHEK